MTKEEKYNELRDLLKANVLEVVFTKVSTGEERTMRCTLKEELLEPKVTDNIVQTPPIQHGTDAIRVFDLDKNAWRSFRVDSVLRKKLL